jgi:hypothetical protein
MKGIRFTDSEKINRFDYSDTDISIKYIGKYEEVAKQLENSGGSFNSSLGILSGLFNAAILTTMDDDEEDIMFVFDSGFIVEVQFEEPEEEEETEEDKEEDKEEEKEPEKQEQSTFPVQDNSNAPEKVTPKREETKHMPFWKL